MAITTYDKLIAGLAARQSLPIYKNSIATQSAGGFTSLWLAGGSPAAGRAPTGAATCTKATVGAVPFNNPGGTNILYLAGLDWVPVTPHGLFLIDRVSDMGGLGGNTIGDQTVNLTIPANRGLAATGIDAQWWLEIQTDIGTTARTLTITYKDGLDADAEKTITVSLGGASPLNQDSRAFPIFPNEGQSIKEIVKCSMPTGTGTAGLFGFACSRIIASKPCGTANVGVSYDFAQVGMPQIYADSCLSFMIAASNATTGIQTGLLTLVEG